MGRFEPMMRCAAGAVMAAVICGAAAQSRGQNPKPAEPVTTLSSTIYDEESVGLTMRLPEGVRLTRNPQSTQRVLVETFDMSWVGTLEVIQTRDENETIKSVTDRAIEANKGSTDPEKSRVKEFKLASRESITINGQAAEQFVIDMTFETRGGLMREVRIYTIFKPLPGTFVIYSVRGDGTQSEAIIKATKASVDTFTFRDPAVVAREIQEGIDATNKALSRLSADAYKKMLVTDAWYRVYGKGDVAEREIAYYRIQEDTGPRGALSSSRDSSKFSAAESEEGLLVSQSARFIAPSETSADEFVSEVESLAWMAFDRKTEVWTTQQVTYQKTPRGYRVASRSSISGTRENGRINVIVTVDGANVATPSFATPDAYLSQAEQHLIYRILNPGQAGSYEMYLFRPQSSDVKRRSEIIKATENPDRFTVESRQDPSQPATIKTITAKGEILRMVSPEGQITEQSNPADLQRLWRAKGLPTGPIRPIVEPARPGG